MDFILEHEVLVIVLLHAAAFAAVLVLCSVRDGFGGDAVVTALMAAAVCFGVLLVCVLISNILGFIKQPWGMAATLIIPFAAAVKTGLARESESREEPTPPAAPVTRVTPVIPVAAATRTVFAAAPGPSLSTACATFFAAVSKFQEINGDGSIHINRNEDGQTIHFYGFYCNKEDMDCSRKLAAFLGTPGLRIVSVGDSFQYEVEVGCGDGFSLQPILAGMTHFLPGAAVTGRTELEDFCSLQFRT